MKKLLILSNGIMLILLLASNTTDKKREAAPNVFHDIKLGVDPELAKDMVSNFKGDIWNGRKINNSPYLDSRSVWFSLYKLKKFIKSIEDKTPASCIKDEFDLGIRIYFGDYPSNSTRWNYYSDYTTQHQLPGEYKGLHSVVMVPTLWNSGDEFHYDFDPRQVSKDGKCIRTQMKDVMDNLMDLKFDNRASRSMVPPAGEPEEEISNKMAFMIIPDNLDNKRFFSATINTRSKGGPAVTEEGKQLLPTDADFANAGTLVPPPYPDPNSFRTRPGTRMFHVPYSGASFMRWVDGTNICGWNTETIGKKQFSEKTDKIQIQ